MQKLNIGRLTLGGIVAAVIICAAEYAVNGVLFAKDWADVATRLSIAPLSTKGILAFNLWGLVAGLTAMFLYASLRQRFGPGPKTAVLTGCVVWILAYALAMVTPVVLHMIPKGLGLEITLLGLPEIVIACLAGAALYKEK